MTHDREQAIADVQKQVDFYTRQLDAFMEKVIHYTEQADYAREWLEKWSAALEALKKEGD